MKGTQATAGGTPEFRNWYTRKAYEESAIHYVKSKDAKKKKKGEERRPILFYYSAISQTHRTVKF